MTLPAKDVAADAGNERVPALTKTAVMDSGRGERPVVDVLIAGGGIGGLVTALALHRAGVGVRVFESVEIVRPLGVGINLLPHAVRVLDGLGLLPQLEAEAVATAELIYFNKFGRRIWREPRGRDAGYRWPQLSIHRGRLQMLLWAEAIARLGPENVRTGHHLTGFEDTGDRVVATFADRRTGRVVAVEEGDALIGAEGIHSRARRHFYPDEGPPQFAGQMLWRGLSEADPFLTGRSMVMIGHAAQKFVAYPVCPRAGERGRALVNWVAELRVGGDTPPERDWNCRVEPAAFAPAFAPWRFDWLDVPGLIAAAPEVYEFPMSDRDPLPRWSFGRVTLLGDAAHPMYPIGSNGASQAILDADALADALTAASDVPAALADYERQRLGPTAAIVLSNRQNGPEQVMQLVEERAPDGFDRLDDVATYAELEAITSHYRHVAGFDRESLNAKGPR